VIGCGGRVPKNWLTGQFCRSLSGAYRARHQLAAPSSTQTALKALMNHELVEREPDGGYRVMEPFLTEWLGELVT